jgi:hypothetical protein
MYGFWLSLFYIFILLLNMAWWCCNRIRNCEFESRSWRGVLDTPLSDKVCQWLAAGRWFFERSSGFWPPRYNWNSVVSGVKHHKPNRIRRNQNGIEFRINIIIVQLWFKYRSCYFILLIEETWVCIENSMFWCPLTFPVKIMLCSSLLPFG